AQSAADSPADGRLWRTTNVEPIATAHSGEHLVQISRRGAQKAPFGFLGGTTMTKTTSKVADPKPSEPPDIVLFGLDESRKPRAAGFGGGHPHLAAKAADLMSLTVCSVSSPALAEIAEKLPAGRMYANGRAFVPNVRRDLYVKLVEAAGTKVG